MERKKTLMLCHRKLVKNGLFFLAQGLLQYLNGNQLFVSAADTVLMHYELGRE